MNPLHSPCREREAKHFDVSFPTFTMVINITEPQIARTCYVGISTSPVSENGSFHLPKLNRFPLRMAGFDETRMLRSFDCVR